MNHHSALYIHLTVASPSRLMHNTRLKLLFIIIIIITSTSDLQPSTAIANQLPGQLVST